MQRNISSASETLIPYFNWTNIWHCGRLDPYSLNASKCLTMSGFYNSDHFDQTGQLQIKMGIVLKEYNYALPEAKRTITPITGVFFAGCKF